MSRQRGAEIVEEYRKRDEAPYRSERLRLTVTSTDDSPKTYELEVWRKQTPEETLTLTHVVKPATERDLASLSIRRPDQPTVNVAYAQSTDRFYESNSSKQTFGGLTAQELQGEWDRYDFRLLSEKQIGGIDAYEVEGALKADARSPISRLVVLFRKDTFLPVTLDLFNARGDEIRTFNVLEYRSVDGRPSIWRTEATNHARNSKVLIELLEQAYPIKIEENVFTRENLKRLVSQ